MPNSKDRGMIKWRPFASLPEHMELIEKKNNNRKMMPKPRKSNDKLEEMNELVEKSIENSTKLVLILYLNDIKLKREVIPLSFDYENKLLIVKENNKKSRIKINDIIDIYEN